MASYALIERITLSSSASSVTFDSLPTTGYTDLRLVISAMNTTGLSNNAVTFNGTSTGYTFKALRSTGSATASYTQSTWGNGAYLQAGYNRNGSNPSTAEVYITNYRSNKYKSVGVEYAEEDNGTAAYSFITGGTWSNNSAITSISVATDTWSYAAGSTFDLYGISTVGATPAAVPLASGGDIVTNDGTYWYHAFLSSGTFVPTKTISADVLVVAGGGSGGSTYNGGGGGAGGLRGLSSQTFLSSTSHVVTIGAGGTAVNNNFGNNGNNSTLVGGSLSVSATGGGTGGWVYQSDPYTQYAGAAGGSGGGGQGSSLSGSVGGTGNAGGYSPVEGYAGGTGSNNASPYYGSGGGGGAGGVGANGSSANGGAGGVGSSAYSSWGSATSTGQNVAGTYYYAGGGGGAKYHNDQGVAAAGAGGNGGGGAGSSGNATAGTVNTGGGGGGGERLGSAPAGAAGGSGIVIVRYPM